MILNWNKKDFLEQNLESALSQSYKNCEVIVIDNGSTDGSIEYLKNYQKKDKKLRLLENRKNLGYVPGYNKGIKRVLKEGKSDFIVLLNNDVKVEKDWLRNLISAFKDPRIGICTSKILLYYPYLSIVMIPKGKVVIEDIKINRLESHALEFEEGFDQKGKLLTFPKRLKKGKVYNFAIPYRKSRSREGKLEIKFRGEGLKLFVKDKKYEFKESGSLRINLKGEYVIQNAGSSFNKKWMLFEDRFIFEFDRQLQSEIVDAGCGASMAIRCDLLKRLGVLAKRYFFYFEDSELSFRFMREGFSTKFVHDSICYHIFWGSSGGEITSLQATYGTRNRLWFARRYFGILAFWYFYLRTFARTVIWGILSPFSSNARMYFASYLKALKGALESDTIEG